MEEVQQQFLGNPSGQRHADDAGLCKSAPYLQSGLDWTFRAAASSNLFDQILQDVARYKNRRVKVSGFAQVYDYWVLGPLGKQKTYFIPKLGRTCIV